jgi:nucleotide-binding universal stress UspA family protein
MFRRMVVLLDGSPEAATALPMARTLALATGAEIELLRVVPSESAAAGRYLEGIAEELSASGVRVSTCVRKGDPRTQILAELRPDGVDQVVMAVRAHASPGQEPLGHLAEALVEKSPAPVLVVPPGGHPVRHIKTLLVPMRGHPGSTMALGAAVKLARATGASLVLLEVMGSVPAYMYEGGLLAGSLDPEWELTARANAQTLLDTIAARLRVSGIAAQAQVRVGSMPATLLEAADEIEADMIVITTHAQEPPANAALGSTASRLLRIAHQPVLLIRHEVLEPASIEAEPRSQSRPVHTMVTASCR